MLLLMKHLYKVRKYVAHWQQYWQLIARFAGLGPEARNFLLHGKMVGRCLDFFFDTISPLKDMMRNMDDIEAMENTSPDIGLPTIIDKKNMSFLQEQMEKRREKRIMEARPNFFYFFETLGLLIRSCKAGDGATPL